jgi:putative ABC transport system permease protein
MNDILYMAWRYLKYHWIKTLVLLLSISLILFLPLGLQVVVQQGAETLTSRADSTPLLIGARGSAVDLVLGGLYFREPVVDPIPYQEVTRVNLSGLAIGIPLHLRFVADSYRIVGTTAEYFEFRGLIPVKGRFMTLLGECVLGAGTAKKLRLEVGDYVLSTPAGAFDVAGTFPLKMKVVGILGPAGTPDDGAIFTDIKTTWVIAGLAHGHMDMAAPEAQTGVLKREGSNVVANAAVLSYTEITPDNINSFHFHGNPGTFPVDAVLAIPRDRKSSIVLRGRYEAEQIETNVQMLVPLKVINSLLKTVFSVRDFIVLGSICIIFAATAITILVFVLSIQLRRREIETIRKIGGPRRRLRAILFTEILMVVCGAVVIAGGMTAGVSRLSGVLIRVMAG